MNIRRRFVTNREILQRQKSSSLNFTYLGKKSGKYGRYKKLREKNVEIMGKKPSAKNDPYFERESDIRSGTTIHSAVLRTWYKGYSAAFSREDLNRGTFA